MELDIDLIANRKIDQISQTLDNLARQAEELPVLVVPTCVVLPTFIIIIGGILLGSGGHEVRNFPLGGSQNLHQAGGHLPVKVWTEERGGLAQVSDPTSSS